MGYFSQVLEKERIQAREENILDIVSRLLKANKLSIIEIAKMVDKDISFIEEIKGKLERGR